LFAEQAARTMAPTLTTGVINMCFDRLFPRIGFGIAAIAIVTALGLIIEYEPLSALAR
jgi:hypothetical protein